MKLIDLTGQRFGHVTVLKRTPNPYKSQTGAAWMCECDCGKTFVATSANLRSGRYKSCGCESRKEAKERFTTHGMSKTRLYHIWAGMKKRCYNKQDKSYGCYGGHGITVCDAWREDFQSFADWAKESGYNDKLTIDRINSRGNYEPDNCRWASRLTQSNNTRRNHELTFKGKTQSVARWADEVGLNYHTLESRINFGWPVERALTAPARKLERHV